MTTDLAALHAPYTPLLRYALAQASPTSVRLALDIGCGPGLKSAWLAEHVQLGGRIVGMDVDREVLREATKNQQLALHTTICVSRSAFCAGDALALPLRAGCADLAWCVAALRLFAEPASALRELRRVLRPDGVAVIAVAEQLWVRARRWPEEVLQGSRRKAQAAERRTPQKTEQHSASRASRSAFSVQRSLPLPAADGLGDELRLQLAAAGFAEVSLRAFLLDPSLEPLAAALALADWQELRGNVAPLLSAAMLHHCDAIAAENVEPDLAPVLLVATGCA